MREHLIQYVELLFAGGQDCEDIKQEILQNTLDRYDDLIAEGKVPEAAYRLAITGIGDINEILGATSHSIPEVGAPALDENMDPDSSGKKLMRAIAIGLYILCPLPLILLSEMFGWDTLGLCGTLVLVAFATVLIILGNKKSPKEIEEERFEEELEKNVSPLGKSIGGLVWAVALAIYFLLSFSTNYWHITWVIFPIAGAVDNLIKVILQNKEAQYSQVRFPSRKKLRKSIDSILWAVGLAVYFIISFATNAWYITWLIFPITGAVQGLISAVLDLKEAAEYET